MPTRAFSGFNEVMFLLLIFKHKRLMTLALDCGDRPRPKQGASGLLWQSYPVLGVQPVYATTYPQPALFNFKLIECAIVVGRRANQLNFDIVVATASFAHRVIGPLPCGSKRHSNPQSCNR